MRTHWVLSPDKIRIADDSVTVQANGLTAGAAFYAGPGKDTMVVTGAVKGSSLIGDDGTGTSSDDNDSFVLSSDFSASYFSGGSGNDCRAT